MKKARVKTNVSYRRRMIAVGTLFAFLAVLVLARSLQIQVIGDPKLERLAVRQFNSKVLIRPRRGLVLDRNGDALAINGEVNSLAANPLKIKKKEWIAKQLSKVTGIERKIILQRLKSTREFVWIQRHVSSSILDQLKKNGLLDRDENLLEGLWLVKETRRIYPRGDSAAHILGSVNIDLEGLEGLELLYNEKLRGKLATVRAIRDNLGRPTFIDAVAVKQSQDGENLVLTLDSPLQFEVEKALLQSLSATRSESGTAIVMNSETGDILALANLPTYNPNVKRNPHNHRRNRAITDGFEPGSILKPLVVATALENGWNASDKIWGEKGSFVIQNRVISEAETHEKFEWLSLTDMLKVSSNVVSAKLALRLGPQKVIDGLKDFGLSRRTGIGFPGELAGWIPAPKNLPPLSLATIGFGQGIFATPIQMITAYSAFLNEGKMVQPRLIQKIGNTELPLGISRQVMSAATARQVTQALALVTQKDGTGKKASLEGYRVAGKTGTAQMVDPKIRAYSKSDYISSFVGFAVGVEPKIVIFTSLNKPRGVYYASDTAAPLFREILKAVVNRYSIPADPKFKNEPEPVLALSSFTSSAPLKIKKKVLTDDLSWTNAHPSTQKEAWVGTMPSLSGMSAREVLSFFEGHSFGLKVKGVGTVKDQKPRAGEVLKEGDLIVVRLTE